MAHIRIHDLPVTESLTPEEQERILGAGRPSFRPTFEGLENRELYAANLGGALTQGPLSLVDAARGDALVRTLTPAHEVQVGGLGAPAGTAAAAAVPVQGAGHGRAAQTAGLTGQDIPLPPGVPPVSGQVAWGQWQDTGAGGHKRSGAGAGGVTYVEEITKDNVFTRTTTYTQGALQGQKQVEQWVKGVYDVKVWNNQGWLILEGRENPQNHTYTVKKWDDKSVLRSTEVWDKVGSGQKRVSREALSPGSDGRFTEETWGANGRYVKNVWTRREHGGADSMDHISQTVWEGSRVTITLFHQAGYYEVSSSGWGIGPSKDANVTYVYSVDATGLQVLPTYKTK